MREVQSRYLALSNGATEFTYNVTRSGDTGTFFHSVGELDDISRHGAKKWTFSTTSSDPGYSLQSLYQDIDTTTGSVTKSQSAYTWSLDSATTARPYISSTLTTLDPGTGQVQKRTDQTIDTNGNVTSISQYDFGLPNSPPPSTPWRTYTNTYVTDPTYTSLHINNRLVSSTVTKPGVGSTTLVTNTYDSVPVTDAPGITMHDTNYGVGYLGKRGNPTNVVTLTGTTALRYDIAGNQTNNTVNGVSTNITVDGTTHYAAPSMITTNSLQTQLTWQTYLALASETGPNLDTTTIGYDAAARPSGYTSPYGAPTTITYSNTAPQVVTTTNGRWVKSTYDGFGRTVQTDSGTGSSAISESQTQYTACGCSPLGKVYRQSMPYVPLQTVYWTTYGYDGLGRTTSVTAPDGSVTTYSYVVNTVKITDAKGNWRTFTMDAFGNLKQVDEIDPNNNHPITVSTTYTYDVLNHLTGVSMPRPTGTQTRTFNYSGAYLLSATNPENGTVSYTYNPDGTMATKTDAKNQQTQYSYDNYKRVTQIRHYPVAGGGEDTTQQVNFAYDTNALDTSHNFSSNTLGRLATVTYGSTGSSAQGMPQFAEWYSYHKAGGVTAKRLQVNETIQVGFVQYNTSVNLDAAYGYNTEGKVNSVTYPSTTSRDIAGNPVLTAGPAYTYSFDSMMRPNGLTDQNSNPVASNVSYGPSNELTGITYFGSVEGRTYNSRLQLTHLTISTGFTSNVNITYNYPAQNIGKISSQTDNITMETVSYAYDSLNRLITAQTTAGPSWSQSYGYDSFGNLTQKTVTGGTPLSVAIDPNTNRILGTGLQYDSNGNMTMNGGFSGMQYTYDIENRMVYFANNSTGANALYAYNASNKRVWQGSVDTNGHLVNQQTAFLYGIDGQRLGSYQLLLVGQNNNQLTSSALELPVYLGQKRIGAVSQIAGFFADRLGSNGKYFPYGEDKSTPPPANDQVKFATYLRDSISGLDYADQRYYSNQFGRFMSPDRGYYGDRQQPQSLNMYTYVVGDPMNSLDPTGLCDVVIGGITNNSTNAAEIEAYATVDGAISVYPYSGNSDTSSLLSTVGSVLAGIVEVAVQRFTPQTSTYAAVVGLILASRDGEPIDVTVFSGGAEAFTAAISFLNNQGAAGQAVVSMIDAITYVAPGTSEPLYNNGNATFIGGGAVIIS